MKNLIFTLLGVILLYGLGLYFLSSQNPELVNQVNDLLDTDSVFIHTIKQDSVCTDSLVIIKPI